MITGISRRTLMRNAPLVVRLTKMEPGERKQEFFRILNLLEIKVAAKCEDAEQEVHDFSEIVTAFRAAEHRGYR